MTAYRWTHDSSRDCVALTEPVDLDGEHITIENQDTAIGGSYQLGIGPSEMEIVYVDVARSEPPVFRALRGLWGTEARSHFTGTPLVPARRLYTGF